MKSFVYHKNVSDVNPTESREKKNPKKIMTNVFGRPCNRIVLHSEHKHQRLDTNPYLLVVRTDEFYANSDRCASATRRARSAAHNLTSHFATQIIITQFAFECVFFWCRLSMLSLVVCVPRFCVCYSAIVFDFHSNRVECC